MNKRFFLAAFVAAALCLPSCGDDPEVDTGCESADNVTLVNKTKEPQKFAAAEGESKEESKEESCDILQATVCSDDNGDVYYSYNGEKYVDANDLIDVMCPNASAHVRELATFKISARVQNLMLKVRNNVAIY